MATSKLISGPRGRLVSIEDGQQAFVPDSLPRDIELTSSLIYRLDEASRAIATLAGVGETIPNPHLLIRPFVRREAILSSRIEGTQASLSDLFLYEASSTARPRGDVAEVANYVRALEHGLARLEELPICVRLNNEMHGVLLSKVRGSGTHGGELRTTQVWIGPAGTPIEDARYVPPPGPLVRDLLQDWEGFINSDSMLPPLIQCAMMHYQFEAIHPYLDGNGRIGRLLIVLFLCAKGVLTQPLLYLSAYFERDRDAYYDQLLRVSETGDWIAWLDYFLIGVAEQAHDALLRTRRVRALHGEMRDVLQENRESGNALRLLDELFERPFMTAPRAAELLDITTSGARGILDRLDALGIVELYPDRWPRLYVARELLNAIEEPVASG